MFSSIKFAEIHALLHFNGKRNKELTEEQHLVIWEIADGYGKMNRNELVERELTWDWSHIRDSSNAALETIYAQLRAWGKVE